MNTASDGSIYRRKPPHQETALPTRQAADSSVTLSLQKLMSDTRAQSRLAVLRQGLGGEGGSWHRASYRLTSLPVPALFPRPIFGGFCRLHLEVDLPHARKPPVRSPQRLRRYERQCKAGGYPLAVLVRLPHKEHEAKAAPGNPRRLFSFLRLAPSPFAGRGGRRPRAGSRGAVSPSSSGPGRDAGDLTGGDGTPMLGAPNSTALFRGFNHVSQAWYLRSSTSTQTYIFGRSGHASSIGASTGLLPRGMRVRIPRVPPSRAGRDPVRVVSGL